MPPSHEETSLVLRSLSRHQSRLGLGGRQTSQSAEFIAADTRRFPAVLVAGDLSRLGLHGNVIASNPVGDGLGAAFDPWLVHS